MHKIPGEILHDYFKICTFDGETVVNNSQSLNIFIKEGFIFQSQYGYRLLGKGFAVLYFIQNYIFPSTNC